jgi:hypothetical protein
MESQEAPISKKSLPWSMAALVCALVGWFFFQLFGPNPPIIVSQETTVITAPLQEDGLPDYQAYWRDLGREGVTFDNNGAVLFWQAIWPGNLSSDQQIQISDALSFEKIPNSKHSLQDPYDKVLLGRVASWLTEQYQQGLTTEEAESLLSPQNQDNIALYSAMDAVDRALSRPWTTAQFPPLADWVTKNETAFQLLIEASERLKWWSPSPSLFEDKYDGGLTMALSDIQSFRNVSRAFSARAMWHTGEGQPQEAWKDLEANFRLVQILKNGPTIVAELVAIFHAQSNGRSAATRRPRCRLRSANSRRP